IRDVCSCNCTVVGRGLCPPGRQKQSLATSAAAVLVPDTRGGPSVIVWIFQRRPYVIPKRGRHIGSGADDPAEPYHWRDRQQHVSDLVVGRARGHGPGGAPFQADLR